MKEYKYTKEDLDNIEGFINELAVYIENSSEDNIVRLILNEDVETSIKSEDEGSITNEVETMMKSITEKLSNEKFNDLKKIVSDSVKKSIKSALYKRENGLSIYVPIDGETEVLDEMSDNVIENTNPEALVDKLDSELVSSMIMEKFERLDSDTQKIIMKKFIENEKIDTISRIWNDKLLPEVKEENLLKVAEMSFRERGNSAVWEETDANMQRINITNLYNQLKGNKTALLGLFNATKEENQGVVPTLFRDVINNAGENIYLKREIWCKTNWEIQETNPDVFVEIIKNSSFDDCIDVINKTKPEVYIEKAEELIRELYKEQPEKALQIWETLPGQEKKEKIEKILEIVKDSEELLYNTIVVTPTEILRERKVITSEIFDVVWKYPKDNVQKDKIIENLFSSITNEFQEKNREKLLEIIKENNYKSNIWTNLIDEIRIEAINKMENNTQKELEKLDTRTILYDYKLFYEKFFGETVSNELNDKMHKLCEKNEQLTFLDKRILLNVDLLESYTEEQLLRITNQTVTQEYIIKVERNPTLKKCVLYLMENDPNWVISLNNIIRYQNEYEPLLDEISKRNESEIADSTIQNILSIISSPKNYFEVQNFEDIDNYINKRNEICLRILNGEVTNIPNYLKQFNKKNLYRFALLEYKLGISLEEARYLERYMYDLEKVPEGLNKEYLKAVKAILREDKIVRKVNEAIDKDKLGKPWDKLPDSRNIEANILRMYENIFNDTLYKVNEHSEDKIADETYYEMRKDKNGKVVEKIEYPNKIQVYKITKDFNLNVRVEGAYDNFVEPDNFNQYFDRPNITEHGNCESYIGNDSIATAKNSHKCVVVGYNHIDTNGLAGMSNSDMNSSPSNSKFSIYGQGAFYMPKTIIDNTRHSHNEIIGERIVVDENGNVVKLKPDYAIWIEEDTEEMRNQPDWQEKRDNDPQWIMTKKLATQLDIPIVVIDREYFAKREMEKIDVIKRMVTGEKIDEEKYGEYLAQYKNLTKPELITELFVKYENNRVGLQYSNIKNIFTQEKLENIYEELESYIDDLSPEEKLDCKKSLYEVISKEEFQIEVPSGNLEQEKTRTKEFYTVKKEKLKEEFLELQKDDKKSSMFKLMNCIEKTSFYENNKQHSIEHIHKVMLFSELLAEKENMSDEDKKILLVAAALHDVGRDGNDGDDSHLLTQSGKIIKKDHGQTGAELVGELLRNQNNEYGINSPEDIVIIQTAIHYHTYKELHKGKIDNEVIDTLIKKYSEENNIEHIDKKNTEKICELLKDADALDRLRFARGGQLDSECLRSQAAREESTIDYAKEINQKVAEKILYTFYEPEEIVDDNEGNYDYVATLRQERVNNPKEEGHLDFEKIYRREFPNNDKYVKSDIIELCADKAIDRNYEENISNEIKKDIRESAQQTKENNQVLIKE